MNKICPNLCRLCDQKTPRWPYGQRGALLLLYDYFWRFTSRIHEHRTLRALPREH